MSGSSTGDEDPDEVDLPVVDDDVISTGAAADSSGWDERLRGLPRLLRYAMLVSNNARHVKQRVVAEIDELCPNLPINGAWATALDADTGLALAIELDHRAVTQNEPALRSLATACGLFEEYRRVGKALLLAFNEMATTSADEQLCCDIERFVFAWAALPACTDLLSRQVPAAPNAAILGIRMAEHRIATAKAEVRRQMKQQEARRNESKAQAEATKLAQEASLNTTSLSLV
jgi:ATP-dependent Lon protease